MFTVNPVPPPPVVATFVATEYPVPAVVSVKVGIAIVVSTVKLVPAPPIVATPIALE